MMFPRKAQHRPKEFLVIEWMGDNVEEVSKFVGRTSGGLVYEQPQDRSLLIRPSAKGEDDVYVPLTHWIIADTDNSFSPTYSVCSTADFEQRFKLVKEEE